MNKKAAKIILVIAFLSIFSVPQARSWCIVGIGNTCSDRNTQSHDTILGKTILNFDTPDPGNDDISILGYRPFKPSSDSYDLTSPNDFSNLDEGSSKNIVADDGELASMTYVSKRQLQISGGEALWYDVDLLDVSIRCPSCVNVNGVTVYTAGFDYIIDISLQNGGNVPAAGVQLEIVVETEDQIKHYNFNANALKLGSGEYKLEGLIFPKFGISGSSIKEQYIFSGKNSRTFDLIVGAKLYNSNGVTEPRLQLNEKVERVCFGEGKNRQCQVKTSYYEKELCPDGEDYDGIYSCNIDDDPDQNQIFETFELQRLTTDLNSQVRVKLFA